MQAASSTFYSCLEGASGSNRKSDIVYEVYSADNDYGSAVKRSNRFSATSLEPVLLTVIEAALTLIKSIFMPLVMVGTGLGTINALSANLKTTRLVSLINNTVEVWTQRFTDGFCGVCRASKYCFFRADALTLKLTKFASSNLIPVVEGGYSLSLLKQ